MPESWCTFELWLSMFWWDQFNSNIKEISANLVRAWVSGCIPTLTASSTSPPQRPVEVPAEIWKFCCGIQLGGKWSTFFAHSSASWGNVIQTWDLCNQQLGNNVTNRQHHASVFQKVAITISPSDITEVTVSSMPLYPLPSLRLLNRTAIQRGLAAENDARPARLCRAPWSQAHSFPTVWGLMEIHVWR